VQRHAGPWWHTAGCLNSLLEEDVEGQHQYGRSRAVVHLLCDGKLVLVYPFEPRRGRQHVIVNATPTNALALVAVALAVAHAALRLQGRLVVVVAGLWASATIWIATAFAVAVYEPKPSTWAVVTLLGTLSVGSSACALVVLAWQIARRRLAADAQFISRSAVVLGVMMLGISYAVRTPRGAGPFGPPISLEKLAAATAEFTVSLWIISAVLLFGAVSRIPLSRLKRDSKAM
jgi:hypothetical protein